MREPAHRATSRRVYRRRRQAAAGLLLLLLAGGIGVGVARHHTVTGGEQEASAEAAASSASADRSPTTSAPAASTSTPTPTTSPALDPAAHSTTDPASPWVVVNKAHPIVPHSYTPASLSTVGGKQVSTVIVPDLDAMLAAATSDGVHLTLASAYRSYSYQVGVHDRLVRQQGLAAAETVSARPGYSEHQTGLAIDFGSSTSPGCTLQNCYANTAEGRWLDAHAAQYGFLHRYTAADSAITGYASEPWHYRWVGRDLTAAMSQKHIVTLEEFFGVTGGTVYAPLSS